MNISVDKNLDLYQLYVYFFIGAFFMIINYFLLELNFIPGKQIILGFNNINSGILVIMFLIISYFTGHIIHAFGIYIYKIIRFFSIKKEKVKNERLVKIINYIGFENDNLMYAYIRLEEIKNNQKIKIYTMLLGIYKSLFVIFMYTFILLLFNSAMYLVFFNILLILICYGRASEYHNNRNDNLIILCELYIKEELKNNNI